MQPKEDGSIILDPFKVNDTLVFYAGRIAPLKPISLKRTVLRGIVAREVFAGPCTYVYGPPSQDLLKLALTEDEKDTRKGLYCCFH